MSVVDNIEIQIDAEAKQANGEIDKLIGKFDDLKDSLSGVNTKKLKSEMQSFKDFQNQLRDLGKNITVSGSFEGLEKQIERAELRLDTLLKKEDKLQTVNGIDQNAKSFRSLQYDIAEVCGQLDTLYAKRDQIQQSKPLNFWERPDWKEETETDTKEPQNLMQYAADDVRQSFSDMKEALSPVADTVRQLGEEIRNVGIETDNARQKMQNIGGNGLSQFVDKLRSFSVPDAFGKMSAVVRDFQTRLGVRVPTEQYTALAENIRQAETELQKLLDKQDRMEAQGVSTSSASWKGLQYDIRVATDRVAEFNRDMELLRASGGDSVHLGGGLSAAFRSIANGAKGAIDALKRAGNGLSSFIDKIKSAIGHLTSAGRGMSSFRVNSNLLAKSLSRVTTMLKLMITRLALRAVLNNVGEGFKQLARESAEFNFQVSSLMASCKQLAYSIAALAQPILDLLGPALNFLIEKLTNAVNVVNQFLSALSGKSTFRKAKKQAFDYAASLDKIGESAKKTAKEIKENVAAIDELNILSQPEEDNENAATGGTARGGGGNYYDTEPIDKNIKGLADRIREILQGDDWSEIGRMIAAKINDAMAAIPWEAIQEQAQRIAHGIGTLINGFVSELDWSLLGQTIGQGINTAVIFANELLTTIDFQKIGESLATAANSIVNTVDWPGIGSAFANGLNAIIDAAYGWLSTFEFGKFGESVGIAVTNAIGGIEWERGGASLGKAATGLFETLNNFMKNTDFKLLGSNIIESIGAFFSEIDWGTIGSTLSTAISSLSSFLVGVVQEIDWKGIPSYIFNAITDFFTGFDWPGVASSLGELLGSALRGAVDLIGSIWDILKDAWGNLSDYFNEYIEDAGGNIIEGLWNGIKDALSGAGTWIKENIFAPFIDGFKEAFGIASPSKVMKEQGDYVVEGFVNGVNEKIGNSIAAVAEWCENVKETFLDAINPENWADYANDIITGFKDKINNAYSAVKGSIDTWGAKIKEWFINLVNPEKWAAYAKDIITGFKNAINNLYSTCASAVTAWASGIITWFKNVCSFDKFKELAGDLVRGFINGIGALYESCRDSIEEWGRSIIQWFKDKLKIGSPSKVFRELGAFTVAGFNQGLTENGKSTKDIVSQWADSFSDVKIALKVGVDASALKDYRNNYGAEFESDAIVEKIKREVSFDANTSIKADSSALEDMFKKAVEEDLQPILYDMASDMKRQADKAEQTNVYIGNRKITDAVEEQRSANGFRFRTT